MKNPDERNGRSVLAVAAGLVAEARDFKHLGIHHAAAKPRDCRTEAILTQLTLVKGNLDG